MEVTAELSVKKVSQKKALSTSPERSLSFTPEGPVMIF